MKMMVTKKQKAIAEMMIIHIVDKGSYTIHTAYEHKIAEMLVKAGAVVVLKKKNYGRIGQIG